MKKIIETQRAPGAIGPYVQGVDLGSMVFTSGQIPVCPQTGEIPADVQDQARLSVQVARLPKDVKLEIEAIAVRSA